MIGSLLDAAGYHRSCVPPWSSAGTTLRPRISLSAHEQICSRGGAGAIGCGPDEAILVELRELAGEHRIRSSNDNDEPCRPEFPFAHPPAGSPRWKLAVCAFLGIPRSVSVENRRFPPRLVNRAPAEGHARAHGSYRRTAGPRKGSLSAVEWHRLHSPPT
jgi:hypothetical protein